MNIVINQTNRLAGYYDQYATTMTIHIHDMQDNKAYACQLQDVYPKSIQAITLDNNSKDVIKLAVTFTYKSFINENIGLQNSNLVANISETTLQEYQQTSLSIDSVTNELYYSNFQEYQQRVNDNLAYTRSILALERQGIETNQGGIYA